MKKTILLILSLLCMASSNAAAVDLGEGTRHAGNRVIYEVFVRNFSSRSNFAGVEAQIPRLKELGVDVVWLMPIYAGGRTDRWGTYNSPYAVRDYKALDPMYGNATAFRSLVDAIHAAGMEVWLDWVANHTSTDAVWVTSHPEYYGSSLRHPNGWNDVYQLDYSCREMRDAMIDAMKYWVSEFDIDGYRCDYADGVPLDFWQEARAAVDAVKPIAWLAESAGEGSHYRLVTEGAFDMNYAWSYNTTLLNCGTSTDISAIKSESSKLHNGTNATRYADKTRLVYLSNHDVVQDHNGTEVVHFGDNLEPMTVLMFTVYGTPLIYNGQEIGYSKGQVLLAEKTVIDWDNPNTAITELITTLCRVKHTQSALDAYRADSQFANLNTSRGTAYAFKRTCADNAVVTVLNFAETESTFKVMSGLPEGRFVDVFTGTEVEFPADATITLPAKGYAVYVPADGAALPTVSAPADEGAKVYYNLQGVAIERPYPGQVVIEKSAAGARKLIF